MAEATATLDRAVWTALGERMTGEAILPGDERMILLNKHYVAGAPQPVPQAYLRCRDLDDVRRCLDAVRAHDLPFAIRSGGHCFADLSSSAGAVIDLAGLDFCRREGDDVIVGPGLLGGDLSGALAHAGLATTTGGCPWVGIGGFSMVGGFGFLGRTFGLGTDRVRAFEVLTADGDLLTCHAGEHADLYWALRGAGAGGFGVVVSMRLRTAPFPPFAICFGAWPLSEAERLIDVWQQWAVGAEDHINLELGLIGPDEPEDDSIVKLYGIVLGEDAQIAADLGRLRAALGPLADGLRSWRPERKVAAGYLSGLIDHQGKPAWQPCRPYPVSGFQFTRSHFYRERLAPASIRECVRRFGEDRRYAQFRELEFIPWGGAYAVADDSACFGHRDGLTMVRHVALVGGRADADLRAHARAWVDASQASLAAHANGRVYQGYADPLLPDWPRAYYGDAYPRLQSIKARYDPANAFRHAQSIRLPGG